jgi:predicted  nucleic acid-binding Zn-ribbon protein
MAGAKMKIYFCDVCNESIPLQDIKDGVANTVNGKIYCHDHNPLRVAEVASGRRGSDRASIAMFAIVIVLLGVVLGLMLWGPGADKDEFATVTAQNKVTGEVTDVRNLCVALQENLDAVNKKITASDSEINLVQTDIIQFRGDLGGFRGEIRNLSENLKSASNLRAGLQELQLKLDEFNTRLSSIEGDLEAFRQRLSRNESEIGRIDKEGSVAASSANRTSGQGNSNPAKGQPVEESEQVKKLKAKLSSKDNSARFEAVNQVYDERIKEALPFLLPLLEDSDQFVQVGAIQTVGEFLYLPAIPILIKVLRDQDVTVREEALLQLIRMSGETSLNFDPRGSNSEREKAIRKWEDWLKKNQ